MMKRDLIVIGHPQAAIANEEQHLLDYLMRNRRVLWINHTQGRDTTAIKTMPHPRSPLVSEFTPHPLTHMPIAWLEKPEQAWLKLQVQGAMRMHNIQRPIVWVNTVMGSELATRLAEDKVIYFCNENVQLWPVSDREIWLKRQAELITRADLILATDPAQVSHFPVHKTCLLNSTPTLPPLDFAGARPKDLPRGRPIAGFYGSLDDKFDWALLAQAARSRPDWHWVLVGPNKSKELTEILRNKNIFWLGEKNYDELASYLPHWQLLLLPYLTTGKSPFHPLKLHEYLAQDKPLVMTMPLPHEHGFRPLVSHIHSAAELAELLPVHYFISQEPRINLTHPAYAWETLLAKPAGTTSPPRRHAINWEQQAAAVAGLLDADSHL